MGRKKKVKQPRQKVERNLPEFAEGFLRYKKVNQKCSENTIRAYRFDIYQFFDWLKTFKNVSEITLEFLETLTANDLYEWEDALKVCVSSEARKISAIHSLFRYLNKQELVQNTEAKKLHKPPLPKNNSIKYLPSDKAKEYKEKVMEEGSEKDLAIIDLLFNTGVRISELINLNIDDIDGNVITIRDSKGHKTREIVVEDEDIKILKKYLKVRPKTSSNALFLIDYNVAEPYRITYGSVRRIIDKYAKMLKIKKLTPHMFRHTFGTSKKEAGVSLDTLADLMGHESIKTTMIYAKVTRKEKERVAGLGRI